MPVAIVVAVLNFLGSLLPQLPAFIDEVRGHPDLSDDGKAALSAFDDRLAEHERKADAAKPLPDPKPTAPG